MPTETVLITGATKGIGLEFAKVFADHRNNLVLVARNATLLEQQAEILQKDYGVQVNTFAGDLSSQATVENLHRYLKNEEINIDILINNAGAGGLGLMTELDIKKELECLQLNMISLTYLTRLIAGEMVKRKQGKILNVASTAAFQPTPGMSMYGASKSYVLTFSEAIAEELKGTGVHVSVLCPPSTKTPLTEGLAATGTKIFIKNLMDPEAVAKYGFAGLMKNKTVIIPGFKNKIMAKSVGLLPRKWVTIYTRKMIEQKV
ncbi:SDR family oxidoreductase [Bacillus sp. EB106-08-02-XG196]|uniref:SDR family NAD(P)-dependent oxidoreductase n=1 Tax=Bacillus sp. EB106-08-02-XG196 TaxID=2737049 RepID=UPI0015C4BBA6|nr:SDR family oxidoreductase [Bacillus sp. EB106-08-02-XG196]NWQ43483.1 SDR family oxidoreductase [Bacillus sp. EB106-08-02-XG196]